MIEAQVTGDTVVAYRMRRLPASTREEIRVAIGRLTLRLQRRVMRDKLSGQVLKVRTGTLRRSINQVVLDEADGVAGIVSTNVKYGRLHEYGLKGEVTVKAHLRTIKKAFGKSITPMQIAVKQHTAQRDLPKRSFLRTALEDIAPQVRPELEKAIARAIGK